MTANEHERAAAQLQARERKQLQAMWRQLAKVIGPGRKPSQRELDARWREVMGR